MIEYLKKNRYGRATFLPLTSVSAPEHVPAEKALGENGVIGIASSLVHTQPQYEKVAGYLLGRVLVMDTIEHAVAVARSSVIPCVSSHWRVSPYSRAVP